MMARPRIRENSPEEEADIQKQIDEEPQLAEIPKNARVLKRGRPPGQTKMQVTVRLDIQLISELKKPDAKGWQTRLNEAAKRGLALQDK